MTSQAVLRALAEPRRPAILRLVRDAPRSVGDIAAQLDISQQAVSQHLQVLREAGLVAVRRQGTRRLYSARPEGLAPLRAFLEELWDDRLDALRREAEQEESRMTIAETTVVERELEIAARPQTVWEFLVDPRKAERWMGTTVAIDARPGGHYRAEVCPGGTASGVVVELDAPRRLVWTWGWEPGMGSPVAPGTTRIEVDLEPVGQGTRLRLRHLGLPDAQAAASHDHGWEHYLERLRVAAGGGDPGPDPWAVRDGG